MSTRVPENYNQSPIPSANSIATNAAASVAGSTNKEYPFYTTNTASIDYDGILQDYQQFPSFHEFDAIVNDYLQNLSSKKRDKALVDTGRYALILQVLKDPRNTAISTAQFRFWVKKMFKLVIANNTEIVCHDDKPVATRESIYDILIYAHKEAHHGGRDKTSALVRRRYSWIPKELIARFVRHCPFCISRRNGCQSPSIISGLPKTPPHQTNHTHPGFLSSPNLDMMDITPKSNRSPWTHNYYSTSVSMAANIATSAAAAVASSYIHSDDYNLNHSVFDQNFFYSQPHHTTQPLEYEPSLTECCSSSHCDRTSCSPKPQHDHDLFKSNCRVSPTMLMNIRNKYANLMEKDSSMANTSAAAIVAAAALAAINSNNQNYFHHHQQPSSPSESSVSSMASDISSGSKLLKCDYVISNDDKTHHSLFSQAYN